MHSMCTANGCDCTCHEETNDPDDELPTRGTLEDDEDDDEIESSYEPVYDDEY